MAIILATLGFWEVSAIVVASFVAGASWSYFFLRANPNKKAQLDKSVDKAF